MRSTTAGDRKHPLAADPGRFPKQAEGFEERGPDDGDPGLFTRTLSPRSPADSSVRGDVHGQEQDPSGHQGSREPSGGTASGGGRTSPSLGNPGREDAGQGRASNEVLDANANPAPERGAGTGSWPPSGPLAAGSPARAHEGRAEDRSREDRACVKRDFPSEQAVGEGSARRDCGTAEPGRGQAGGRSAGEESGSRSSPPASRDPDPAGHSAMRAGPVGAGGRDGTVLLNRGATAHDQAVTADSLHPPRRDPRWEDAGGAAPECDPSPPSAGTPGHVCPPGNGVALSNDSPSQTAEGRSGGTRPEDRRKDAARKQRWKFLESQGKAREGKTTTPEQIREPADGEDTRGAGGDPRRWGAAPTGDWLPGRAASGDLPSRAEGGVTGTAEAGLAMKTAAERPVGSASAREKAIVATLPRETARSDRPVAAKGAAFDPQEGGSGQAHRGLCQGAAVGGIRDKGWGAGACVGICNVHAEESDGGRASAGDSAGKTHDRERHGPGTTACTGASSQAVTADPHAASELVPADTDTGLGSGHRGPGRQASPETDPDTTTHSAFTAATHGAARTAGRRAKAAGSSGEDAVAVGDSVTPVTLPSRPTESEDKYKPAGGSPVVGQYPRAGSLPEDASRSPRPVTADSRRGRGAGQPVQPGAGSVETSLGPAVSVGEAAEDTAQERHRGAATTTSCFAGDKKPEGPAPPVPAQAHQPQGRGSLLLKHAHAKTPHVLLFLVFLVTIYQYDFMIGLAFYLVSLSWLSWGRGRHKEAVKKK